MTVDGIDHLFEVADSNYDLSFDATTSLIADNVERILGVRPFVWTNGRS
jgi:hypothetical protein